MRPRYCTSIEVLLKIVMAPIFDYLILHFPRQSTLSNHPLSIEESKPERILQFQFHSQATDLTPLRQGPHPHHHTPQEPRAVVEMAGAREDLLPNSSSFTPNKAQADGASKEVVVRGLPPRGVLIASGDDFGVKEFSAKEVEALIRHGVALEAAPVLPLGAADA